MLLSGSRGAPYTCLRCQLRQAIFPSQRRCIDRTHIETARSFSATQPRREQEDEDAVKIPRPKHERSVVYHHPLGRIVGAPGRRQRQGTQTLKIDAMKKPFEVIVMQDVREPEEKRVRPRNMQGGAVMSAEQIQRAIAKEGEDPTQDEVNESISALQPDTSILDEEQYKALAKTLADGFTTEQLHNFFTQSLNLSAVEGDTDYFLQQQPTKRQRRYQRTQWRPGRTRLDKRLPMGTVVKKSEKANKPKIVDQILRLTWGLAIHAEEQKVGELEMYLQTWELAYLFDLQYLDEGGTPKSMYESFVDSAFLLRACDVRPYRPHGYLRISGRRQDAEEIARKIERRLPDLVHLAVKLGVFQPLLGTTGWPKTYDTLFRKDDVQYIQTRTSTVIEQPRPGTIQIYASTRDRTQQARRLLLSLLELPTSDSTTIISDVAGKQDKAVLLPQPSGSTMHLRHRKRQLTRLTLPTARTLEEDQPLQRSRRADKEISSFILSASANVVELLADARSTNIETSDFGKQTYWDEVAKTVSWRAQFCTVLSDARPSKKGPKPKKVGGVAGLDDLTVVVGGQTRGLEVLLSFFAPRLNESLEHAKSRSGSLLVARFVPSPFTDRGLKAMSDLPPVELVYRYYTTANGTLDLWLVGAQACLEEQECRVSLPSEATDLRLQRAATIRAKGTVMQQDADVAAFTQTLRDSLRSSRHASLLGEPQLRISLPAAVASTRIDAEANGTAPFNAPITYIFTGFEQRQTTEYSPIPVDQLLKKMDPEMKDVLASFGDRCFLQLKEVSAGAVGGRRTEVWLQYSPPPASKPARLLDEKVGAEKKDGHDISEPDPVVDTMADDKARLASNEDASSVLSEDITSQLVKTALGVVRLLTKINEGELQPMQYQQSKAEEAMGEMKEGWSEEGGQDGEDDTTRANAQ